MRSTPSRVASRYHRPPASTRPTGSTVRHRAGPSRAEYRSRSRLPAKTARRTAARCRSGSGSPSHPPRRTSTRSAASTASRRAASGIAATILRTAAANAGPSPPKKKRGRRGGGGRGGEGRGRRRQPARRPRDGSVGAGSAGSAVWGYLSEALVHGWDLAVATRQGPRPIPVRRGGAGADAARAAGGAAAARSRSRHRSAPRPGARADRAARPTGAGTPDRAHDHERGAASGTGSSEGARTGGTPRRDRRPAPAGRDAGPPGRGARRRRPRRPPTRPARRRPRRSSPTVGTPPSDVCPMLSIKEGSYASPEYPVVPHYPTSGRRRPQQVIGVDDPISVALLGKKALPVCGVLGVDGVAGDHRVEPGLAPVALRSQQSAQALRLLLPRPERPRHLHGHAGLGQVDREVGDLADHQARHLAPAERVVERLHAPGCASSPARSGSPAPRPAPRAAPGTRR